MNAKELTVAAREFTTLSILDKSKKLDEFRAQIIKKGTLLGIDLSNHLSNAQLSELETALGNLSPDFVSEMCSEYRCFYYYKVDGTTLYIKKMCFEM